MTKSRDEIIRETVGAEAGKPPAQIADRVKEKLEEGGHPEIRAVEELDRQTRINPNCNNDGNIEARFQYRVNHGDGTYSDPWWTDWRCL